MIILPILSRAILRWASYMSFALRLPHRKNFRLSQIPVVLCILAVNHAEYLLSTNLFYPDPLRAVTSVIFGALLIRSTTEANWGVSFYLGICASFVYVSIFEVWTVGTFLLSGVSHGFTMLTRILWLLGGCAIFFLIGATVSQWLPVYEARNVGPRQMISTIMLFGIFIMLQTSIYVETAEQDLLPCVLMIMGQVYCLTLLYLQAALFQKSAMREELKTMNLLWHQHQAQYELAKENIALINQKCHDLKHQMAALRSIVNREQRENYVREIDKTVHIYDSIVRTNNETLDTVLTEKSLLCESLGINISCVADGKALDFMDPVDIYAIMGNALDNAIEAVRQFEETDLRIIDVLVHVRQKFLVISVTNPIKEVPVFEEGIPISSKPNDGYHGFGIRSMRHTAQKYHGELTITAEDGCFSLRVLVPQPEPSGL